jgi:uncharacterized membrane protein YfcA
LDFFYILVLAAVFVLAAIAGGLSNFTGGGAGVFTIFVLVNYLGLNIQQSIGTVLAASTFMVLVGVLTFYRSGQLDLRLSLTIGVSGLVGGFLTAILASSIQSSILERVFGFFTLSVVAYMTYQLYQVRRSGRASLLGSSAVAAEGEPPSRWTGRDPASLTVQAAVGVLNGALGSLFGIGGAWFTMIMLLYVFRLRPRLMLGTALLVSLLRFAGGSVGFLLLGLVDQSVLFVLIVGGVLGAIVGARFAVKQTSDVTIRIVIIALMLYVTYNFLK